MNLTPTLLVFTLLISFLQAAFGSSVIGPGNCTTSLLGVAQTFDTFVFGDSNVINVQFGGKVAIGGNATFTEYELGTELNCTSSDASNFNLIVGGSLTSTNGELACGSAAAGSVVSPPFFLQTAARVSIASPLNFTAAFLSLSSTNLDLCIFNCTQASISSSGGVTFTYTGSNNVYCISAAMISSASSFSFINFPEDFSGDIVINILGSDGVQAIFSNAGDDLGNLSSSQILWNACNSTNIQISAFHLYGSLLAPFSTVTLNNGQQTGTTVAGSLSISSFQQLLAPYSGFFCPSAVSLPSRSPFPSIKVSSVAPPTAPNCSNPLGAASGYSTFVLGDLNITRALFGGPVVVGGSANMSAFLLASQISCSPNDFGTYNLIVGGDLFASSGEVFCGSVLVNGTVISAPTLTQSSASVNHGSLLRQSGINLANFEANLNRANSQLCSAHCTMATVNPYGVVTFDWDGVSLNSQVFCLDDNLLSNATYFLFNFPVNYTGAIAINILNTTSDSAVFSMATTSTSSLRASQVLWNMCNIISISVSNIQLFGSLLAPSANVSFREAQQMGTTVALGFVGDDFEELFSPFTGSICLFPSSSSSSPSPLASVPV